MTDGGTALPEPQGLIIHSLPIPGLQGSTRCLSLALW